MKKSVKLEGTDHRKKKRKTKYVASRLVQLNGRSALVSACAVYNKPHDAMPFAFYATNNLTISGPELWAFSRARWHIEEMFRALKQSLSFLKLPAVGEGAAMASICIPFAILTSIHLEPELWDGKPTESIGRILGRLQEKLTWDTMDEMVRGSKRDSICYLRKRRPHQDERKKPVNPTAEELRRFNMSA